jgi:glutamyl-Q tRNA(Asp) synthetase
MIYATRFAPSPSGYLHRGHAYSALTGYRAARRAGGRFILRIEDIDSTRCKPEFEAAIHEDLAWLGVEWETPVRRQSEHFDDYRAALDRLIADGLAYRCFKTRKQVIEEIARAPHHRGEGPEGQVYRGAPLPQDEEQRLIDKGQPYAWRLSLDRAKAWLGQAWDGLSFEENGMGPHRETGSVSARPDLEGDVILARKDVGVAYHLAVVVDDALQGVTEVTRGVDLFDATHIQRLLQALLALPTPRYHHHRLILGADGKRLAKRDKAETLRELRARGVTPEEVLAGLGFKPI